MTEWLTGEKFILRFLYCCLFAWILYYQTLLYYIDITTRGCVRVVYFLSNNKNNNINDNTKVMLLFLSIVVSDENCLFSIIFLLKNPNEHFFFVPPFIGIIIWMNRNKLILKYYYVSTYYGFCVAVLWFIVCANISPIPHDKGEKMIQRCTFISRKKLCPIQS